MGRVELAPIGPFYLSPTLTTFSLKHDIRSLLRVVFQIFFFCIRIGNLKVFPVYTSTRIFLLKQQD